MADNKVKYTYTDEMTGKSWRNENKASQTDPDFKGLLCTVEDVAKVTSIGPDGKKKIEWDRIPGERKKAISIWNNDGVLNIKVARRDKKEELFQSNKDDDFPF